MSHSRSEKPKGEATMQALAADPLLQAQEARETIKRTLKALDRWIARKNEPATWGRAADLNHLADQLTELAHERFIDIAGRRRA